jgi:hypothetical protein
LHHILSSLSKDTGDKISFNFQSFPTVYDSSLVSEGTITNGTNVIRLGTNVGWAFKIITAAQRIITNPPTQTLHLWVPPTYIFEKLSIVVLAKAGESTFSIQPFVLFGPADYEMPGLQNPHFMPTNYESFTICLSTNSVLVTNHQVSFSGYETGIDEALNLLLESQDAQFPLTTRTNAR